MSLYTETFSSGTFDNTIADVNGLKLSFSSVSERCNDTATRVGSNTYKNIVTFLKDGLNITYVKFHAHVSGTYSLTINNGTAINVVSNGDGWITFNLTAPLSLTKGVSYTFAITAPSSESQTYTLGAYFTGTYWSSSTSYIGTSTSQETISMEFGFINSLGSFIPSPLSLATTPASLMANMQSNIPTGTFISLQVAVSTSNVITPSIWSNISNLQVIRDVLFTSDLSNKYLWIKYTLSSPNTMDNPILNSLQIDRYIPSTLETYLYKTEDSWLGVIPASVVIPDNITAKNGRIKAINVRGTASYFPLVWDEMRKRFTGLVKIASMYRTESPNAGNITINTELSETTNFSSISQNDLTQSISTHNIYRRTSADGSYQNMSFNPVFDGTKWQYNITNFAIYTSFGTGDKNNVVITIPFHPITSKINIKSVTSGGSKYGHGDMPNTDPIGTGDGWWWDDTDHTLYVRFGTIGAAYSISQQIYCTILNLTFESDTDLFATRYDVIQTGNIGERIFFNGLILANQYYCTSILGDTARQVDTHVRKTGNPVSVVVDCMERVAVHVNNAVSISNNAPDYKANIVWKSNFWDYILSENNGEIQIKTVSDPTKWQAQISSGISVERIVSIRANSRMGKQDYKLTNTGTQSRTYPFVWGKEPWASDDRQENDRGIFAGDLTSVQVDVKRDIQSLSKKYMLHYDSKAFVGMGVMFPQITDGNVYFVKNAPIYNTSPYADYPIPVNTYSGYTDVDSMFFEKVFTNVQPNQSVYVSFYQGQYSGNSFADLYLEIDNDYSTLLPAQITVTGQTLRVLQGGKIGYLPFDLKQQLYKTGFFNGSTKQVIYANRLTNTDTKQSLFNNINQNSDSKQIIFKTSNTSFDTLFRLLESGIIKTINFDTKQINYRQEVDEFTLKQIIYQMNQNLFSTQQSIFTSGHVDLDALQKLVSLLIDQNEDITFNITRKLELTAEILRRIDLNLSV